MYGWYMVYVCFDMWLIYGWYMVDIWFKPSGSQTWLAGKYTLFMIADFPIETFFFERIPKRYVWVPDGGSKDLPVDGLDSWCYEAVECILYV